MIFVRSFLNQNLVYSTQNEMETIDVNFNFTLLSVTAQNTLVITSNRNYFTQNLSGAQNSQMSSLLYNTFHPFVAKNKFFKCQRKIRNPSQF